MELRIQQQYAKIGMDIKEPFLALKTTQPAIELHNQAPSLQIESPDPKLYIDQSQCFADAGLRKPLEFKLYYRDIAQSVVTQGIARRSSDGDILAKINQASIAQIAAKNGQPKQYDFNVTAIPKQPPTIKWDIQPVNIEFTSGSIDLQLRRGTFENNFQRGQVDTYIAQKNYLQIDWLDNKIDQIA